MHPYKLQNAIFDDPVTNLLSVLCILIEVLLRAHAKDGGGGGGAGGRRSLNDFKFGTFIGRFPSHGASSMAVKGLKWKRLPHCSHLDRSTCVH